MDASTAKEYDATMPATSTAWRRYVLSISLIVSLFVLGVFISISIRNRDLILDEIRARARAHFHNIVLTRRWSAQYGGVFVKKTEGVESNPYLENPDIHTVDGLTYTMKNPALMTREISVLADESGLYRFHITSLQPLNPNNIADAFEREALLSFERGEREAMAQVEEDGKDMFRYMAPLMVEESCLSCHSKQGYELGQVRGGISVTFDITSISQSLARANGLISILGTGTLALLLGLFFFQTKDLMRKLQKATLHIATLAASDPLTNLYNRRHFFSLLEAELKRTKRYDKPLSCIMLDLDYFKKVNDTHGHSSGDLVLKDLALLIQANIRDCDVAARYGGEEFVILLPETSLQKAFSTAEKLRELIEDHPFQTDQGEPLSLTASFGCAAFKDSGGEERLEGDAFVAAADQCMYQAKRAGRNQVACTVCTAG